MRAILILFILASCAHKPRTYSEKMDKCISKYLDQGINSGGAVDVCQTIHLRKND